MKKTIISKIIIEVGLIDLLTFLSERGYLEAFLNNTYASRGKLPDIVNSRPDVWMSLAFVWDKTPEGYEVWRDLSHEWKEYLLEGLSEEDIVEWRITSAK